MGARPHLKRARPGLHLLRPSTMLAAYFLWCCLLLGPVGVQSGVPLCSQVGLRVRSSRASASHGGSIVFAAKVANTGTHTLSGVGVRLDVPTGLVGQAKPSGTPVIVNGGTTAYWTDVTLRPGKRRVLKFKAHACGSATPGSFPVGGAVYLVNATDDITCLSAAATKPSTVRVKKGGGLVAAKKAVSCPTPAPTPAGGGGGPGFTLYAEEQTVARGTLVGYTGAIRRGLQAGQVTTTQAAACQALCSGAGYTPMFYFSVRSSDGACYCSQDNALRYSPSFTTFEATEPGLTNAPTAVPTASPSGSPTTTPTTSPTTLPSASPSASPSTEPTQTPSAAPTSAPTAMPSQQPSASPSSSPTALPSAAPTQAPTTAPPTGAPTDTPTAAPTTAPTAAPTTAPTMEPTTAAPTLAPTSTPPPYTGVWTLRTSAADNSWVGVTYGNGLFVAVANSGTGSRVMTSPDGIDWTLRTSAANNWYGVTYGNGLFVAVSLDGTGNRVMTSPDGITWTIRATPVDNIWFSVTYGNGLFVAVSLDGPGNRVMTSPDGITWTSRTSAAYNVWRGVTYGNGLFVAVSSTGTGNRVMTSSDGNNWTIGTSAADNDWHGVTYGNGMFVAVSYSGTGNRVMTSP